MIFYTKISTRKRVHFLCLSGLPDCSKRVDGVKSRTNTVSGGHAVTVNVPAPTTNGGTGKIYSDVDLTNGGGSGTIVETIGHSVGAKAKNYDVYNPLTGETVNLVEGSHS